MSTVRPIVSVLVLAYNHGKFIREALQGIVEQVFDGPYEVLVGDDASTDDTRTIALEFAKNYPGVVEVVSHARNVGMHANHAELIRRAKGQFLAYCDGDDFWHARDKLQQQVELLLANPGVGAVHADFDRAAQFRSGWKRVRRSNFTFGRKVPVGDIFAPLLKGNFIQTCTLCVRTDLVRQYLSSGLPIETYPVGDWPLCIYVSRYSNIDYMEESVAVYRRVIGSAMNAGHAARLKTAKGYIAMIASLCRHLGADDRTTLAATKVVQRAILSFAVFASDKEAFCSAWSWLSEHDPEYLSPRRRMLRLLIGNSLVCRLIAKVEGAKQAFALIRRYSSHG